ncbi:asparagine synthase-related protein, partial [Immundisolibacter sp.]|uniref:asparagine synthase-related protein n=1 Tax=Immundisolibacter sp. TaxID=1934948 RepID=UPI003F858F27
GLVCLPGVDLSLDEPAIADYLAAVATEDASTPYRGIRRLPPGSVLTWTDTAGSRARLRRYWHITSAVHVRLPTADDYAQAVRERLQRIIAHCCDTEHEVGVILSGGLDSSTLAALAADHLAGQGRRLLAASSVLPAGHQGPARDERPYIEALCARYPNIVPHWVTATDRRIVDGADEDLARRGQPPWNAFAVMDDTLHETLLKAGARVVINGLHGDSVWSFEHPVFPLDFLLRGHPLAAWREWAALSRRYRIGRRTLAKLALAPVTARLPAWRGDARRRLTARIGPTAVTLDVARRTRLARRARRAWHGRAPQLTLRAAQRFDLAHAVWPRLREEIARTAAWLDMSHRSPLWDRQIVTLCLSAPPQALHQNGFGRALVRTIGNGLIPETIRTRTDKGAFLPDFHARVQRERDAILTRVAPARAGRLAAQYIDFTALDAAFETLTGEVPVDRWSLEAQCVIVRGHSMACFLHHYERARTADSDAPTRRSRA